jgi:hypothetical protein
MMMQTSETTKILPGTQDCPVCRGTGQIRLLGKATTMTVHCPKCRGMPRRPPAPDSLQAAHAPGIAWHLVCELRARGAHDAATAEAVAALEAALRDGGWEALDRAIVQALGTLEREPATTAPAAG